MNTDNVVILTPTMREALESIVAKGLEADYFGDHIAAVRAESIGNIIGRKAVRGCHHIWQFSDTEVDALLCGIDCLTAETEPDHLWQPRTKTVESFDSNGDVRNEGLQVIVNRYLSGGGDHLPGLWE